METADGWTDTKFRYKEDNAGFHATLSSLGRIGKARKY